MDSLVAIDSRSGPRPLRVAIVTETFPPEVNGVARTVGVMVDALRRRGHRVQVVRPRQKDDPPAPRADEHLVRGFSLPRYSHLQMGLASSRSLARAWQLWLPDVVHVVTEGPLGWAAVAAARRLGLPVTSDFHTNFHTYSRHYGFGWLAGAVEGYLRALHNRADCTMVPTAGMKAALETMDFGRVRIVGRGVDDELFHPRRRSRALRTQWGCHDDEIVVLSVGRLAPEKNLALFAQAAGALQALYPELRVVLVGDGPEAETLRRRHPGFIFSGMRVGEDLAAHYASADVFLFPSTTETFGNVTLEAMASGLAVVAYDYAAAHEYVRHGENGLLAPLDDEAAFLRTAVQLVRDPALVPALKRKARETAEAVCWGRAFADLERVLRQVIDGVPRNPADARLPVHDLP